MQTTIYVYRVGRDVEKQTVELPEFPKHEEVTSVMTPLLDNANPERIRVRWENRYVDMFFCPDGVKAGLPRNDVPTEIFRENWLRQQPETDPDTIPAIHGPCVLCERQVWF